MARNDVVRAHVRGQELLCPLCGEREFFPQKIQLATSDSSVLNVDWWGHSEVQGLACISCGRIEMLYGAKLRMTPA